MLKIPLNIQKFAVSASISGENYGGSSTTNQSYIRGTITISTTGQTHNYDDAYYQINGGTPHYFSIGYNETKTFSYDGLGPYQHNPDGTLGNQTVSLYVRITSNTSTSTDVSVNMNTIPRYAITNSATGSNIEDIFKVNYTKYVSSWQYKLRISIPNIQLLERIDYNTSGAEFELKPETIDQLFSYYNDTKPIKIGFAVETYNSNGTLLSSGNEVIITGKIEDANPIFSNFTFEDINPTTLALTGDESVNVNGYSTIRATISQIDHAEAQKRATMSKYKFSIGTQSVEIPFGDNEYEDVFGEISNSQSGTYTMYAVDSRNNATLVSKLASQEIAYTPISFISSNCEVKRNDGGVGVNAELTISGNIWNDDFGEVINSIKRIEYQYKKTTDSEWITFEDFEEAGKTPTSIIPIINGNTFAWTGLIASIEEDYSFALNSSYDFRIIIEDELSTATVEPTSMASAIPNISLADDGVGIMCDYDESLGGLLQVGGKIIDGLVRYLDVEQQIGYWLDGKPLYSIWHSKTISSGTQNNLLNINRNDYGVIWVNKSFSDSSNSKSIISNYYYASDDFQRVHIEQGNQVIWQRGTSYPKLPLTVYYELRYTKASD